MDKTPKIFIDNINDDYVGRIREAFDYLELGSRIKHGDTVFIKPNLTFPHYVEGVMTSYECIESLVIALKDYTNKIVIGESDGGGYNRFSMDEVFEKTGLKEIEEKYDIQLVNLSKLSARNIHFEYKRKQFAVPMPTLLLDEADLFITAPVPKVHSNTGVSMSIKNQWGCIQEPKLRLKLHPYFAKVIAEINKSIKVAISVIDGTYGLNRNGPMRGDAVKLGWMMACDNILAGDIVCTEIMQIKPESIKYFYTTNNGQQLPNADSFQFNQNYKQFIGPKFKLKRDFLDYPGFFAFRSPFLAYLAYHSPLSKLLHKVLYLFREEFYEYK